MPAVKFFACLDLDQIGHFWMGTTSQGVSAGLDMALWLVGQLHSPQHARMVRKVMQYDPAPPYTAEV